MQHEKIIELGERAPEVSHEKIIYKWGILFPALLIPYNFRGKIHVENGHKYHLDFFI